MSNTIVATATGVRQSAHIFHGLAGLSLLAAILSLYLRLKSLSLMSRYHHQIPKKLCTINRCYLPECVELPFLRVPPLSGSELGKVLN